MGAGPEHLLSAGAVDRLIAAGHDVRVEAVSVDDASAAEIAAAFDLQRGVAAAVRSALEANSFPIVLSGNCNMAALGTLGGLASAEIGILWFDAHGDFNTPETTIGGFLDGMALAMATGRCWRGLLNRLPGFAPVDERNVVLLGARDLDPLEARTLSESAVSVLSPNEVRERSDEVLDRLRGRVRDLYVHVDLDVLDPETHGRANRFAVADGLSLDDVASVLGRAGRAFRVRGAAITAYDPAFDGDGRVCHSALGLLDALAQVSYGSMTPEREAR